MPTTSGQTRVPLRGHGKRPACRHQLALRLPGGAVLSSGCLCRTGEARRQLLAHPGTRHRTSENVVAAPVADPPQSAQTAFGSSGFNGLEVAGTAAATPRAAKLANHGRGRLQVRDRRSKAGDRRTGLIRGRCDAGRWLLHTGLRAERRRCGLYVRHGVQTRQNDARKPLRALTWIDVGPAPCCSGARRPRQGRRGVNQCWRIRRQGLLGVVSAGASANPGVLLQSHR
mmetsp:Transcript_108638/g.306236  ORF Transcript_108638/g.306236 Transcript_108638/m.306236 type:complete len:228 (-) Transcript_108638:286-969(-)